MLLRQVVNPLYVAGRIKLAWWEWRHPDMPWLHPEAVGIIGFYLTNSHVGLEYGSGRSTLWLANRLKHLTSVEHDRVWYERVKMLVANTGNVDLLLRPVEHEILCRTDYAPMPAYVAVADRFADESLDFCLIDGSYREACVHVAAPKLKVGGMMVLDNMNWHPIEHWRIPESFRLLSAARNVKTQTGVFIKTR